MAETKASSHQQWTSTLVLLAVLGMLTTLSVLALAPPPAVGPGGPPAEFAAGQAMAHLREVARRPHPLGTPDNARVRDYIATTARSLGADVAVESGQVVLPYRDPVTVAFPHNVVATVHGSDPDHSNGKALLLVAHYDSVPTGPGAADDGAAVAALLETMRILLASGGVRNDVVFLFTDGEEVGLLGAELFVRQHGVERYGAVLNWEARGGSGPVMMFETSSGNGELIQAFTEGVRRPVANSLAYEVYRRMPNSSDFTVFRESGAVGLNAAFIGDVHSYHSPRDDVDNVSRDSVQHQGEMMVGLVDTLGNTDLTALSGSDAVYFDLFARVLVSYPSWLAAALAVATVVCLLVLVFVGWRRGTLRLRGTLTVAGMLLAAALVAGALCFGVWQALAPVRPGFSALPLSEPYDRGLFIAGFLLLALAVLAAVVRVLRGRPRAELVSGSLVVFGALLVASVVLAPGMSYLFEWPTLAGLPALWLAIRRAEAPRILGLVSLAAAPAVGGVLLAPLVNSLLVALGVPYAGVAVVLAMLAGALLVPAVASLPRPAVASAAALAAAVVMLGAGLLVSGFDRDEPRPDALVYLADTVNGEAWWLSGDSEPDEWTGRLLGERPERVDLTERYPDLAGEVLRATAPKIPLPTATVTKVDEQSAGGIRTVSLRVTPAPGSWRTEVTLPRVHDCAVGGQRLEPNARRGGLLVELYGAQDGVELICRGAVDQPIDVDVADYSLGLPADVAELAGPRPDGTISVPYGFRAVDTAIVTVRTTV